MKLPSLSLSLQFSRAIANSVLQEHRTVLPRHCVQRWLRHALQDNVHAAEITVRIVDTQEAQTLNNNFRHRNYATNVLTFNYTQAPVVCADLVLCADVVALEAKKQNKTLSAHYAHLLVHGTLHAQGFDHEICDEDADFMEDEEIRILAKLGFSNPYAADRMEEL